MSSQNTQSASQVIPKQIAVFAQLNWIFVALAAFFYYLFLIYQYHQHNIPAPELISAAMGRIGLASEIYSYLTILADVIFVGAFMAVGLIMYLRRGNNPTVYMASITLFGLTVIFTGLPYYLTGAPNEVYILSLDRLLGFIGNGLSLIAVYSLPDGQFTPRWTFWLTVLSIIYLIFFFASSNFWSVEFNIATRLLVFLSPTIFVQAYKYRHVLNPAQRQQAKWAVLGIVIGALAFFVQGIPAQLIPPDSPDAIYYRLISLPIRSVFLTAMPLGLGFAALRYRLWDVDLTLNRSIVLALLTVALGGLFLLDFFLVHALLNMLLPANHQVLAAAIAAAISVAAFNPTRRLVRHFVDRRFYGFRFDLNELRSVQQRNQEQATQGTYTGRMLEGYRLGNLIGRGGMGEVYEGLNGANPVAIKALPASYFHDETSRRRFEREAEATKRLSHPNIVKVLGSGISEDLAYIILEYVSGNDLKSIIQERGALPLDETLEILRGITEAVDAVHEQGIVHRDLKPSNIMLPMAADGESYHPVLMDFGLARLDNLGSTLTGSGAIGTVAYMSPEQFLESKSVDSRADIYALGIIVYEMLAGRPPFEGNPGQIMFAQIQQPAPDLRETIPTIPASVAKAIQKAMAKDASERFKTAGEFLAALEMAAH